MVSASHQLPGLPAAIRAGDARIGSLPFDHAAPINPLGVKGAGEAGMLPVPAAVANAVKDALRSLGDRVNRMPLNPSRISDLVHQ
jgi:CO/xanthine dehydrogenase Mo-binding subunit